MTRTLPEDFRKASNRFLWRIVRTRPDQIYTAMKLVVFGRHLHKFTMEHVLPTVDSQLAQLEGAKAENEAPRAAYAAG